MYHLNQFWITLFGSASLALHVCTAGVICLVCLQDYSPKFVFCYNSILLLLCEPARNSWDQAKLDFIIVDVLSMIVPAANCHMAVNTIVSICGSSLWPAVIIASLTPGHQVRLFILLSS
jgi:hypothetical protein